MTKPRQMMLPLDSRRVIEPTTRVRLSETDIRYRQNCIEKGVDFTPSFLKETRAQRLGCSVRDLDCMFNYELNRELADEAVVMRLPSWATDRAAFIDWEMINKRAIAESRELAEEFAAFRRHRRLALQAATTKEHTPRRKP